MLYSSLALVAMAASAAIPPFGGHLHMHPTPQTDSRVQLTLVNRSARFHDVKIGGRSYEILPSHLITIKALPGTVVYHDSAMGPRHRGDVLISLTPELNGTVMELK